MAFHKVRLSPGYERGAQGGPVFSTTINGTQNNRETRGQNWFQELSRWDIGFGIRKQEDIEILSSFFRQRRGRLHGFLFKDWSDYQVRNIQHFGDGDGALTRFQLRKVYGDPSLPSSEWYERKITRPIATTVRIFETADPSTGLYNELFSPADYMLNEDTGVVTLTTPLALGVGIYWTGEFDIPVRFDVDSLDIAVEWADAMEIRNINVMEIRE